MTNENEPNSALLLFNLIKSYYYLEMSRMAQVKAIHYYFSWPNPNLHTHIVTLLGAESYDGLFGV